MGGHRTRCADMGRRRRRARCSHVGGCTFAGVNVGRRRAIRIDMGQRDTARPASAVPRMTDPPLPRSSPARSLARGLSSIVLDPADPYHRI
jgi:hypothetical protein